MRHEWKEDTTKNRYFLTYTSGWIRLALEVFREDRTWHFSVFDAVELSGDTHIPNSQPPDAAQALVVTLAVETLRIKIVRYEALVKMLEGEGWKLRRITYRRILN